MLQIEITLTFRHDSSLLQLVCARPDETRNSEPYTTAQMTSYCLQAFMNLPGNNVQSPEMELTETQQSTKMIKNGYHGYHLCKKTHFVEICSQE